MAGKSEQCRVRGGKKFADVLPLVLPYLNQAQSVRLLPATSQSIRKVCLQFLKDNSASGKGFVLAALNDCLPKLAAALKHNKKYEQLIEWNPKGPHLAKCLPVDSTACKAQLGWALRACGKSMLQDEQFAADVASMFCSNIKEAAEQAKMTDASADVLSYLVGQGFRAP